MTSGNRADPAVERGNADEDVASGLHQSFEDRNEFRRYRQLASDDFLGPSFKAANPLSEHHAEGLQQAPGDCQLVFAIFERGETSACQAVISAA